MTKTIESFGCAWPIAGKDCCEPSGTTAPASKQSKKSDLSVQYFQSGAAPPSAAFPGRQPHCQSIVPAYGAVRERAGCPLLTTSQMAIEAEVGAGKAYVKYHTDFNVFRASGLPL